MRVDLRSDTVTLPSPGMRRAMAEAEVGDDVYGEDPSVRALEAQVASLLGLEAALFVPSGTMANQIAIRAHTEPGDELIIEVGGHSFAYESGATAALSGVQARLVRGDRGRLAPEEVEAAINPAPDHFARTRLLIIENTANRAGGTIYEPERIAALAALCRARGLALHMDGARLWNAHVALGRPLADFAAGCDSVSVCLSKGLGAPVGSVLAGSRAFVTRAHRFRKMFGGGMRQAGILAAAGRYAIDHQLGSLAEDHARLRRLAAGLAERCKLGCDPADYPTNIAYLRVEDAPGLASRLAAEGVWVTVIGPRELRVVTHRDVDDAGIERAIAVFAAAT